MPESILREAEDRMKKSLEALASDFARLRTGRANPTILNGITINYYGAPMPINQIAAISVPEARLLVIKPYDRSVLGDIEKAIIAADLGIQPQNDGEVIRLAFPQPTEERRRELAKEAAKYGEQTKVAIRNIRRDANERFKKLEKAKEITEDDLRAYLDDVQKLTDKYIEKVDQAVKDKEEEILRF
ncbi:MAG TPA: ribosome recycling factor [Haloplasmataceae bacterium]